MVLTACVAAEARAEQEQEGPDALATAVENMRGDRIDEGDARSQILMDAIFDTVQLTTIGIPYVRHRVHRGGDRTLWHAADGRAADETKSRESRRNPCIVGLTEESTLH
jgi:hypothetical protein